VSLHWKIIGRIKSKTAVINMQGILAFFIRLLPQTQSTTSQLFSAGPLRLVYHATQSQLQATYYGVSVTIPLLPDMAWHAVALAWQAEVPCVMLDKSDWTCANRTVVAQAAWNGRLQNRNINFGDAPVVLGGLQSPGYEAGAVADVDNVCVYPNNSTSISPEDIRAELMLSALEDHLQCDELDECGNKQANEDGGFLQTVMSGQAAQPIVKINFDRGASSLPLRFANVSIKAHQATFVLSGAPTHDRVCIADGPVYPYRLPITLSADDEEVFLRTNCGSYLQVLDNIDGVPGARLPARDGAQVLDSGFSVFLAANTLDTDVVCHLYIQQGKLVTKRWIHLKHVNLPPEIPFNAVETDVVEDGILLKGKANDPDDNSVDIIIAAVPEAGTLSHRGSALRVGDNVTMSKSGDGFTWQLHWNMGSSTLASEPAASFAYAVSDGCSQTAVQHLNLTVPNTQGNVPTFLGPSGLALCFNGNSAVHIRGVDLAQGQRTGGFMSLVEAFSLSLWFKTRHVRPAVLASVGPFRLTADGLKGITFSVGRTESNINAAQGLWYDGAWHHAIAAWDPRRSELQLSLDSQQVQTKLVKWQDSNMVRRSRVSDLTATIGEGFSGCIDEFAVVTNCTKVPGSPQSLMQQVRNATKEGPISGTCQGPVYFRFNDHSTDVTNEWANPNAKAQLQTDNPDELPAHTISSIFPHVDSISLQPVKAGGFFMITPEVSALSVSAPRIQINTSFGSDADWRVFVNGSSMHSVEDGDIVDFPAGSYFTVNTTVTAFGLHTLWCGGVGNSEYQQRYILPVEGAGQVPTCNDTVIVSDSEKVSTIAVPECMDKNSATLKVMVVAKPALGVLTYANAASGVNTIIDAVPFRVQSSTVQYWKPKAALPFDNDQVSFVAVNARGLVSNEVSVAVSASPTSTVLESPTAAMNFVPGSPGAVFPALREMFSPDDFARFQSSRNLPGIALQLSTSAAIATTMYLVETSAYAIAISRMSSVVVEIGGKSIINLPVPSLNDGGWHPLSLQIQNEEITLIVDDRQGSTELSAQQFNTTLAAVRDSSDVIRLGQIGNTTLSEGFQGRLRSVYVTSERDALNKIPLQVSKGPLAASTANAVFSDWPWVDQAWTFVVDEDSSLAIDLVQTLSLSPASFRILDLPASGQLGVVNASGIINYVHKPHTALSGRTVVYETAPNECSDTAGKVATFLIQELHDNQASSPFSVNIHINCKDDPLELLKGRFTVHMQQNSVQRILLDEFVRDVDGDVVWELTGPPSNGHLLLEDGESHVPLVNRSILPKGKTNLLFRPLLSTYGAPYTSFSFLARDQHTELPEIEVRIHVDNGLAISQQNSNAGSVMIAAMDGAWGPAMFDTWFKKSVLEADTVNMSCQLLPLLGLGDLCSLPRVNVSLVEDVEISANRWHLAVIAFNPPEATVAIDGKLCTRVAWRKGVQTPPHLRAPANQGTVSVEALRIWGLPSDPIKAVQHLNEGDTHTLELSSVYDFYHTSNSITLDATKKSARLLNNVNRTQLYMPVPRHVSQSMLEETPLVKDYGAAGTAGHALLLNGDMSITVPAHLNTTSFTIEGWFKTGQASGQTAALLDIGSVLVVGWTQQSGLTIALPALDYSLQTSASYNDGAWHYLQVAIEWLPAGNLRQPRYGHNGKLRLALSIDAQAANVGYIPYQTLADRLVIGRASGFLGYANLIDEFRVFSGARDVSHAALAMSGQLNRESNLVASLSFSEGHGSATLEQVSGKFLPIEVEHRGDVPLNTAWVVSTAPAHMPILQLPANTTTRVALGVDAESDDITAIISAEEQLPDPAVAALLLPGCISPILNSCRVRASHLPISLPLATATLYLTESFGKDESVQRLLGYKLSDGHRESGPYSLYAQPASTENRPPLIGRMPAVHPVGAHSPHDIPAHVVNLTGLSVDPEGQSISYFVSLASGSGWLHTYDNATSSKVGRPIHEVQGKYNAGQLLRSGSRKFRSWHAAEDVVVIVPVVSQGSVGLHIIACDSEDTCSDAVIDIALDPVRNYLPQTSVLALEIPKS
jgi:hypothetical protein